MKAVKTISGVNIQWPWSQLILSGRKSVETRTYPLPKKYVGKELAIIETPGRRGKKMAGISSARIIGTVVFSGSFRYQSKSEWLADKKRHQVEESDPLFGYTETRPKWGWLVESIRPLSETLPAPKKRGIVFAVGCRL